MNDLNQLDMYNEVKGVVLLHELKKYRKHGVPASMLIPTGIVKNIANIVSYA